MEEPTETLNVHTSILGDITRNTSLTSREPLQSETPFVSTERQNCNRKISNESNHKFIQMLEICSNYEANAAEAPKDATNKITYSMSNAAQKVSENNNESGHLLRLTQPSIEHKNEILNSDAEIEQTIALLDSVLESEDGKSVINVQRGRSRSLIDTNDVNVYDFNEDTNKYEAKAIDIFTSREHQQQFFSRQNPYSRSVKSKVSKWTKVKAAFKWERANVPTINDNRKELDLQPVNYEIARYLRVPSGPCAGCTTGNNGSPDVLTPISDGNILNGALSSASSSIDDIHNTALNTSAEGKCSKCDVRLSDSFVFTHDGDLTTTVAAAEYNNKSEALADNTVQQKWTKTCRKNPFSAMKSSSLKSMRKCKVVSDFVALPEDVISNIKSINSSNRKVKSPPSPLNLNLKQELNDSDCFPSPNTILKSPKDGTTPTWNNSKRISSPGNSSVPSSPSRHSDFFIEFESEDLSSGGDFSEPASPHNFSSQKTYEQKQNEIKRRYKMLRAQLDKEFETKRHEWEKIKSNPNACRAITLINSPNIEERSLSPVFAAELWEESLTPDFKKKLRKWRVKKQTSLCEGGISPGAHLSPNPPLSPGKESKTKIDWNLWKTGQLKLEGQGLSPLPEQKDLPEEFQKKLEQWQKIKRGGNNDSVKRALKCNDANSGRKSTDDELEKDKRFKSNDKNEKLAKLKAMVVDHPKKEIQVKTSVGVMKFKGISRKFTRKLYEWEKARGIKPESSTFALLHPGYCPIDVDKIHKEHQNGDSRSKQLSRSLSLDSVTPNNICQLAAISQQASSLSLNDVNDLKEMESLCNSCIALNEMDCKKMEEPEAVMVEVEDHIVETACALITSNAFSNQQTPVYKYEEIACNDICNSRRIQSYESHTNLTPFLSALKRTDETFVLLKKSSLDIHSSEVIRQSEFIVSNIRNNYPYYMGDLMNPHVLNAILDVQSELGRVTELMQKSPLDEACCQEIMEERNHEYIEELRGLHESLQLLRNAMQNGGGKQFFPTNIVPDISVTLEDDNEAADKDQLSTTCEATDELSGSHAENDYINETKRVAPHRYRSSSFTGNNNIGSAGGIKKKLRLRKMGSRQNSKTESSNSSDDETTSHSFIETPRRWKRKNFRQKQRSLDEDNNTKKSSASNKTRTGGSGGDISYCLKLKPGELIEQYENNNNNNSELHKENNLNAISGTVVYTPFGVANMQEENAAAAAAIASHNEINYNNNSNIFVKTERKFFTTIRDPTAMDGIAVVEIEYLNHNLEGHERQLTEDIQQQLIPQQQQMEINALEKNLQTKQLDNASILNDVELLNLLNPKKWLCFNLVHKALSLSDIRFYNEDAAADYDDDAEDDDRKIKSLECIHCKSQKCQKNIRLPLANDSFRIKNNKILNEIKSSVTVKDVKCTLKACRENENTRREHIFKKNPDKNHIPNNYTYNKCNGATIKKIETKIAKNNIKATIAETITKLSNNTAHTTNSGCDEEIRLDSQHHFHNTTTTTTNQIATNSLTQRAQRLQKAKEHFLLQGSINVQQNSIQSCENNVVAANSDKGTLASTENLQSIANKSDSKSLLHNNSVVAHNNTIPTNIQCDNVDFPSTSTGGNVSRSSKMSSKLGFATLASKLGFTKVKEKQHDKSQTANKEIATNRRSISKSQSSPQAIQNRSGSAASSDVIADRLNKSQSDQHFKSKNS